MLVDQEEVRRIAKLARLNLEGEELEKLTKDFNKILEFVDQLRELETSQVMPLQHVLELENVYRDDKVINELSLEDIRRFAVHFEAGYFVVPRVIDT
ncbi:MAG: Asp-tRNA(Asn)/Glu-tRNA(Gln) amidotransferase subunit GatC [Leptospiraceae bacterium]|nr:Asp-tRNA(Asn)/Glu-tRNA(Gln) amidotransferase subunit GatC [Leptospiraceae bacterium]MDW8307061.1 Asp-tRNA(Asn)/Glu-tRNA(Gln) amidotransferase subunit GatC [Leptospiraceae bacterium]